MALCADSPTEVRIIKLKLKGSMYFKQFVLPLCQSFALSLSCTCSIVACVSGVTWGLGHSLCNAACLEPH